MMYWQKDIETMSREELNKLQLERLKQTIELAGHSPFYSKVLKDNGITADSIQSLDDLQKSLSQRKTTCVIIIRSEWQLFLSRIA